jgi:hypothetical protein
MCIATVERCSKQGRIVVIASRGKWDGVRRSILLRPQEVCFCYSGDGLVVVVGERWICRPQGFGGLPRRGLRGTWKFCLLCIIVCICTTRCCYTYILCQRVCPLSYDATKTPAHGWRDPCKTTLSLQLINRYRYLIAPYLSFCVCVSSFVNWTFSFNIISEMDIII